MVDFASDGEIVSKPSSVRHAYAQQDGHGGGTSYAGFFVFELTSDIVLFWGSKPLLFAYWSVILVVVSIARVISFFWVQPEHAFSIAFAPAIVALGNQFNLLSCGTD